MPPDGKGRDWSSSERTASGGVVYFEFIPQGAFVKVSAIDKATGTEISIVGSASSPPLLLQKTALAKLNYVLSKRTKS